MKYIALALILLAFGVAGQWDYEDQYQHDHRSVSDDQEIQ